MVYWIIPITLIRDLVAVIPIKHTYYRNLPLTARIFPFVIFHACRVIRRIIRWSVVLCVLEGDPNIYSCGSTSGRDFFQFPREARGNFNSFEIRVVTSSCAWPAVLRAGISLEICKSISARSLSPLVVYSRARDARAGLSASDEDERYARAYRQLESTS